MKVLIIGAHGNTGQRIVARLKGGPHLPLAMIRTPAQRAVFDALGVPTVLGDLEYPIDHAVKGCDAVLFAAGSGPKTGPDKTVLVDHLGAIRSMVAADVNGARRYVMLSALRADPAHEGHAISHYFRAKGLADRWLRERSGLDWTIVAPGRLSDEPGDGRIGLAAPGSEGHTRRDHVADAMVACLDLENTIGHTLGVVDGDRPVREALGAV
jgi:uncharacterized protein YbjT (DUF2867 family)